MNLNRVLRATVPHIAFVAIGCQGQSPTVLYVLPTGFTGEFRVYEFPDEGKPLELTKDGYKVSFTPDGIAKVTNSGPLRSWHVEKVVYQNGLKLPIEGEDSNVSTETIAIRKSGASSEGYLFGYIGTAKDYADWQNKRYGGAK